MNMQEIVIRISKEVIPHKDELRTTVKISTDDHSPMTFIQSHPFLRFEFSDDFIEANRMFYHRKVNDKKIYELKEGLIQMWFHTAMTSLLRNEEVNRMLVDFIGDDIEIGGF